MRAASLRQFRDLLLLFLWGAFVLRLAAMGQLATYLHPSLQPYTVAAGIVLIILAAFSLRGIVMKKEGHDHSCCHDHDHHEDHDHEDRDSKTPSQSTIAHESHEHHDCSGHEHDHGVHEHNKEHHEQSTVVRESHKSHEHHGESGAVLTPLIFKTLLLLLPLGIAFGQASHYTMTTVQNRGVVDDLSKLPAARASSSPLPVSGGAESVGQSGGTDSGTMPAEVIDLLYAVQMPSYREDFEGKQVEMTAQFVPLTTGNPKGDRFQAVRLFITCCAADAKPVGVTVQYDKPLKISEMGGVKIIGTPTFPMEGGRRTAVLVASKVEECPAPAEPFVY